ncbi:MAG TPA: FAD-dependent oxidoreductase, partial [Candidatus Limnocylindrales bacterium]|nr:FAD-dependent oxidoreductase [Candidatus Limnocylindrales bacterium]
MEALLQRPLVDEPLDLESLAGCISGRLIVPGDDDYQAARHVHQAAVDARPLAIVRPADARDVAFTVLFARDNQLELAIRGGGHSVAGHGTVDGGLVLDLADMRGLHIDPDARVAWAQPGLTAIEFTEAAAAHGLATPFGDTGSVGIAGLTLGGGIGWLVRKHGLTIDALIGVEIVTADGRQLVANEQEHADLFWAVRGGGGNYGVVTRFQYKLFPVGMILGGAVLLPPTADVLRGLVDVAQAAPRELSTISFV